MKADKTKSPQKSEPVCSIERSLDVFGDRWSFLILRQVLLYRQTKFSDFEVSLAIAPNVLTDRLKKIVDAGLLERIAYQEPGKRVRYSYAPTPAGEQLTLVLAALQQWGDANVAPSIGPTILRRTVDGDRAVRVGFLDDTESPIQLENFRFEFAPAYAEALAASAV